jgi:hypothetical protein
MGMIVGMRSVGMRVRGRRMDIKEAQAINNEDNEIAKHGKRKRSSRLIV